MKLLQKFDSTLFFETQIDKQPLQHVEVARLTCFRRDIVSEACQQMSAKIGYDDNEVGPVVLYSAP